ncbi:MAG: IS256 family transposase [Bacteroidetes bacterium]|nr:IS256 family transposase [Bacteroidota bacterium]
MKEEFDYEAFNKQLIEDIRSGKSLIGKDGIFTPLIKMALEGSLKAELEEHLESTRGSDKNRRNGKTSKTVKSQLGSFELSNPRDRNGTFEPRILEKRQIKLSKDFDEKIISLFGLGMSYSDIQKHFKELYDYDVSDGTISAITDQLLPEIREWQNRPLESVYPVIWMDAMHYKVREDGRVISKAIYSILGVTTDGCKEVLGIYIGNSESASFWRQILDNLQQRGVKDIFIACIDNLSGFGDAIDDFFPKTQVQLCIVHQMRNSAKYVTYKDLRAVMNDLKLIYRASDEKQGWEYLEAAELKWGNKYPAVFKSWKHNWNRLAIIFQYRHELKRIIYTTNPIESYHRMVRKVTKTKGSFTSENAILKQVYMAIINAQTKWEGQIFSWNIIRNELNQYFGDRMEQ